MPKADTAEPISMNDIARLKRPKSFTVSILEIISIVRNPIAAAEIFPVKTVNRFFVSVDGARSVM